LRRDSVARIVACVWLIAQLAALAAAPSAALGPVEPPHAARHDANCCPGIAPGQVCPMHHTREGGRTCTMTAACTAGNLALLSLSFALGLPAHVDNVGHHATQSTSVLPVAPAPIVRADLPDPPPPRA
jgi:hypothetical protein